jgi:hypothetical protein
MAQQTDDQRVIQFFRGMLFQFRRQLDARHAHLVRDVLKEDLCCDGRLFF